MTPRTVSGLSGLWKEVPEEEGSDRTETSPDPD